jgi:hypothetical protein
VQRSSLSTQPDSLIPEPGQGAQAWDRYAYVNNNPLRYNDPSGHTPACGFSYSDPECEKGSSSNRGFKRSDAANVQPMPLFDGSLGGNNKNATKSNPPKWAGIIIGGGIALGGAIVAVAGLGLFAKGEIAGLFIAGAGVVLSVLGLELAYQSLGDLRPESWPDHLLLEDFKLP